MNYENLFNSYLLYLLFTLYTLKTNIRHTKSGTAVKRGHILIRI